MLEKVRTADMSARKTYRFLWPIVIFLCGAALGLISKILDGTAANELPAILQRLDITNFLGRFAVWIFLAACIAAYSRTPKRAALNVFLFFLGMVGCYYLYSALAAGFFPRTYAMIWFGITVISPLPAFFCWYAKGRGWPAVILSGLIVGAILSQTVLLLQEIRIAHVPELIVLALALIVFRRKPKEFAVMTAAALLTAVAVQALLPVWG